ncbi:MAG: cation diffusion facilitator family transporter [Mariprofundaceae bacterium]
MSHGSEKAVVTAVTANATVTIAKFIGFAFSGSSALLAEAVHSLADTANQGLLYVGLRRSEKQADRRHHFGYGQERYFWNLISAVTIFFIGCIYTIMHAIDQLRHGHVPEISWLAFGIIGLAFVIEGYSFVVALTEFNRQRKEAGKSFFEYFSDTRDPTTLAVLIEDTVAVFGLLLALAGMGLAALTGSAIFDAIAAILIGLLMGALAFFLAKVNRKYLLNISDQRLDQVAEEIWQGDERIQAVHRVNSIVLSPDESVLMAEVELREETMFAKMSEAEIQQAIHFMNRLHDIRRSLEGEVRQSIPHARDIFIELAELKDQKTPD